MRKDLALLILAPLAACGRTDPDPELYAFEDCDEMRAYLEDVVVEQQRNDYFSTLGSMLFCLPGCKADAKLEDGGAGSADMNDGAASYSDTNVQTTGVDEDDLVETDGTWIYALAGRQLVISLGWPVTHAFQASAVQIEGDPKGIYYADDEVVVTSTVNEEWDETPHPRSGVSVPSDAPMTVVTIVDVTDREAPVVLRESYVTGAFQESRRIDDRLYLVTFQDLGLDEAGGSMDERRARVREADMGELLPWRADGFSDGESWRTDTGKGCGCERVYASARMSGDTLTNVLSLDLAVSDSAWEGESVMGTYSTVYANGESIWLAVTEDSDGPWKSRDKSIDTILHRFDVSGAPPVLVYDATGKVPGTLHDNFSLSEREGVMRVALTHEGNTTSRGSWSSSVYTLAKQGDKLEVLDSYDDLAEGEEIYAVRFIGDLGYVVTYAVEWGDPLFTLDLRDPEDIKLAGELHVDGWSDYLHPIDEDHLLAVGMDWGDVDWQLQVSLFDASDFDNPRLVDRVFVPAGSSEAQEEHHAFTFHKEEGILAIPSWGTDGTSVLQIFHVTPEGITPTGALSSRSITEVAGHRACADIRRSVVMEEFVWAVSEVGLVSAPYDDPTYLAGVVPYSGFDPCE